MSLLRQLKKDKNIRFILFFFLFFFISILILSINKESDKKHIKNFQNKY